MPTINHVITVSIGGVDRSSLLLKDSLYIRSSVGNRGDSCSFSLRDATGDFAPMDWDTVTVAVNGTTVFGGYITSRNVSGIGDGSNKSAVYRVECRDWSVILDTVVIDEAFTDTPDNYIIENIFTEYLFADGFDVLTNVSTVDSDIDIAFENITVREALTQLANMSGARWHIAPDKSLYWYAPTAPAAAAFNIDTVSPNNSTSFDVLADSLQYGVDAGTIVNRVRVIGGEEQTGKAVETFAADGTKNTFGPLSQKPGSVWKVTFTMGGVAHVNFSDRIGYEPSDSLSIDGGDYNTLVNLESRYVKIQKTNGSVPDNATDVTVTYYTLTPVDVTVTDDGSIAEYGRTFTQTVYDETLTSAALAQAYGDRVIAEYAYGRETIKFDVTEHGLLPGRLITVNAPVLGIDSTYTGALTLEDRSSYLLLEDGVSRLLLENYGEPRNFLIQDVTIRTVVTGHNQFMVLASVSAGKYVTTLIDSLSAVTGLSGGVGRLPAQRTVGRLDRLGNDLGEIVAGRATFTDGGTAPFAWDAYNDHTGAVVGLEEDGSNAYGAVYILDDGDVMAKLGKLDGLPAVSGGTPSGWGLYTQNGYFSGVITASEMIGGTIATTTMPINSSNPGVYMTSAGIFAYGTLGLTFSLPSDPAQRPVFSSGTITNTVYEVTTASVLRTGTTGARVQMDNSGIFAYDSGGVARFTVDAATGKLTASQGTFSGTVSASAINGGTITGGQISGGTVTGGRITGGTVSGAVFTGGTVSQGTVSAATISGGTVTGSQISGGTVTGALFSGGSVSLSGGTLTISAAGINHNQSGTAGVYSDTSPLFIRLNTNGTVLGYTGMYVNDVTAINYTKIGLESSPYLAGNYELRVAGHPFITYDYMRFLVDGYDGFRFNLDGATRLTVGNAIVAGGNIASTSSASNLTLGESGRSFRYLYLKDDNGNDRRVSINSSGVLTVT